MLTRPLPADDAFADGDAFTWGPAKIRALATPGHTDGSVSYLVEADGLRVLFCGDAIYDHGQVWDLHSLQHGMGRWRDYHGFLGALPSLAASLRRMRDEQPDLLAPSHGRVMNRPAEAINALVSRLQGCFDSYTAVSALRHYDPDVFGPDEAGVRMPFCPPLPPPACLRHVDTTWVLIAADKSALVMDCGTPRVVAEVKRLIAAGEIRAVEGLWITHYHDDHVDAVPAFQEAFDCPCIADRSVAAVIADPTAWRLPCLSPAKVRVDRVTADGESWLWHEYRLTACHLPGQTLYHGGLLAEGGGRRLFFSGDSFAPAGMDDYCAQNRIFFGDGVGFHRCLDALRSLRPTHLFNPHVDTAFVFSEEQLAAMRNNLAQRESLLAALLPWDHPNYGVDESWVRCHPYEQRVHPGGEAVLDVVVTNHSAVSHTVVCEPAPPWASAASPPQARARLPEKSEGRLRLTLRMPAGLPPGRHVIPITIHYGSWRLPQFAETIVVCEPSRQSVRRRTTKWPGDRRATAKASGKCG